MQRKKILLTLIALLIGISLSAQTTGRLVGRVTDDRGNALESANVILDGTTTGAQTDERGRYNIINITPGVYNVRVILVGYTNHVEQNVRISVDDTRTLNVTLRRSSVDMDEYVVKAKEEMLTRTNITSGIKLNADDISNAAVSDIAGLVALTAGVTKSADGSLNVRGGRANEVVFTVDGMSVSDPVDGGRALTVDMDAIADMKVMTGGFTAEYGNAQSGMVNIVTKDGTAVWEGKIEGITDHLAWKGNSHYDELKFALGGPIPIYFLNPEFRSKLTFFVNGAAAWDDTRYRKHYVTSPTGDFTVNGEPLIKSGYPVYDPYSERDSVLGWELGNRNNNNYNINLKTTYAHSSTQKFTLAVRGDRSLDMPYWHSWKYALNHYIQRNIMQSQYIFTYDHVFDARRTLQVKGSYYQKNQKMKPIGVPADNYMLLREDWNELVLDGDGKPIMMETSKGLVERRMWMTWAEDDVAIYRTVADPQGARMNIHEDYWNYSWAYDINGLAEPRGVPGFYQPGTIWDSFQDDYSKQYTLRADYEYQVSQIVGMKTGFEVIQHDIEKDQLLGFLIVSSEREQLYLDNCDPLYWVDIVGSEDRVPIYSAEDYYAAAEAGSGSGDGYIAKPMQFAYYAQAKVDWEGMIVNAGARVDMWYLGKDYEILQDDGTFRKREFENKDRLQIMVSPRLGISHPISERDIIHFSYNYQNQIPQMQYIFTSKDSTDAKTGMVTVGNPALKPQITVTYEVGLQHLLTEDYLFGITTYYKNFYNYVSTKLVKGADAATQWYEYISEDYGSARGVDFTLNRRLYNFLTGGVSYSLAWANGNNSDTVIQEDTTSLREFPLDWDIRHQFNLNATFLVRKGEEFIVPFTDFILPFSDFSVSLLYNLASGRPYTPRDSENRPLETNSKRKPYTQNTDLRFSKNFATGGNTYIRTSFTIENLFKMRNVNDVHKISGSPYYAGLDISEANSTFIWPETQLMWDNYWKDPTYVNNDRNYIFGISFNF